MTRHSLLFHITRGALIGVFVALALMLLLVSIMTSGASAEEAGCQSREGLVKLLEERFTELPVAAGLEAGGQLIELFASPDSATWTMVVTTVAGESCVMAAGKGWLEMKQHVPSGPAA